MSDQGDRNPLHESFLENLPEGVDRDVAEQLVPHWDKYVQEQFQDRAEKIKVWEPYDKLNIGDEQNPEYISVKDIPPEEMAELLAFRQLDEEQFKQWYEDIGKEMGTSPAKPDFNEYGLEEDNPLLKTVQDLQNEVQSLRAEREQEQQQEMARRSVEWVNSELDKIKAKDPNLTDEQLDAICALASKYEPSEDIVQKGYNDYLKLIGKTEQDFYKKKENQPGPAERGGTADTTASAITDYTDAAEAAKARIRKALAGG